MLIIGCQYQSHAQHPVTWTDAVSVDITADMISNALPDSQTGWGNSGAASTNSLGAGVDGWT